MTKAEALALIDNHKNKLTDPLALLDWVWLRVFLLQISEEDWHKYMNQAAKVLSQ